MNFEDYTTDTSDLPVIPEVPYPHKPDFKKGTPDDYREYADKLEKYNEYREKKNAEGRIITQRMHEAQNRFQADALRELGLTDHPKAGKLYQMAWEHGHASGLSEVWYWLNELKDLIL